MKINNTLYEWLKWICLIALPAIAWFYGAMADTWVAIWRSDRDYTECSRDVDRHSDRCQHI